jgi:hypothetical protein
VPSVPEMRTLLRKLTNEKYTSLGICYLSQEQVHAKPAKNYQLPKKNRKHFTPHA